MKTVLASAGVALALMAGSASASIYQELFPNPNGVDQQQQLRNVGWCGGNAGDPACANRPGDTDPDTDNDGGEGAVSVGTGQDGDAGFAFWSQKGINADGFLFTEEFSFELTPQTVFTWFQRDSPGGADDLTRLALRVGSTWYISGTGYASATSDFWEKFSAKISDLSFFERTQAGNLLPNGGVGAATSSLNSGTVNAFGFWFDGPKTANSRIDTLTISAIPVPAALPLLALGLGGLGLAARRQRRKAA